MRQEYQDKSRIREINLFYLIFWLHCFIILHTRGFKISWYLSASEEICHFGYTNAYHIDTFQKHGNLAVQSQHKASNLHWMDCWHVNRWKEDIDRNGWIKKQATMLFYSKISKQKLQTLNWLSSHKPQPVMSKSPPLWMEPSAAIAQLLTEILENKGFRIYITISINQSSSTAFTDLEIWMHIFF